MPAIKIDPALLMSQSAEMLKLTEDYDHLLSSVSSSLTMMNTRWSANLSNNFAVKIKSAGSSFSFLKSLLTGGASVARTSAEQFLSVDQAFEGLKDLAAHKGGGDYPRRSQPLPNGDETGESVSLYDYLFGRGKRRAEEIAEKAGEIRKDTEDRINEAVEEVERDRREHSVVENENGSISNYPWDEITPYKTNAEGYRYPEAYEKVLQDLQVETRGRYAPGKDTWCNIYVWDATKAMDCEIPHYYNPETGEGFTRQEAISAGEYEPGNPDGYYEMSAPRMTEWLETHGAKNGWIECDAETAIQMANKGMPTVVAATDTNHVGMVVPQREGESGVMISQAGASNFEHGSLNQGFGNYHVKYYYHA